jgi:hypothetical protein
VKDGDVEAASGAMNREATLNGGEGQGVATVEVEEEDDVLANPLFGREGDKFLAHRVKDFGWVWIGASV